MNFYILMLAAICLAIAGDTQSGVTCWCAGMVVREIKERSND